MLRGDNERFRSGKYMGYTFKEIYEKYSKYTRSVTTKPTKNFEAFKLYVEMKEKIKVDTIYNTTVRENLAILSKTQIDSMEREQKIYEVLKNGTYILYTNLPFTIDEPLHMYCSFCKQTREAVECGGIVLCFECGWRE